MIRGLATRQPHRKSLKIFIFVISSHHITSGNNVAAFRNRQLSVQTSDGLNFNDTYDDSKDPTDPVNLNAARQNAFFVLNVMHDFSYRYGFTEDAFNFQVNNFDKGGRGNDGVLVSVQDGSGFNNANFATPPEYVFLAVFSTKWPTTSLVVDNLVFVGCSFGIVQM